MTNDYVFNDSLLIAPLKIIALESCRELAFKVDDHIAQFRRSDMEELMRRKEDLHYHGYDANSYLLSCSYPRFDIGEGRAVVGESTRDTNVSVMVDVMSYNVPYMISDYTNHISPDNRSQDLKRTIDACISTAHKVSAIISFLYESRQHRRNERGPLDCITGLEKLAAMGVKNTTTFDTHDPRMQSTIPLINFDNFMPTHQFVKGLFAHNSNIQTDKKHLMTISPDGGVMNRVVYLANNLGADMGIFYRRRNYSQIINGCDPVVAHEFLDVSVEKKAVLVTDNMASSGESMLDTCKELKEYKTDRVVVYCTFGLLTNGLEKFNEFYTQGYLDYMVTTNLNYRNQDLLKRKWYLETDMSKYMATIINALNHGRSISAFLSPTKKVQKLVQKYRNGGYGHFQRLV